MTILQTLILSLVEGITEFLPVSSTGHLILASQLLQIPQSTFLETFEIIIQFGAILAVLTIYIQKLLNKKYLWKNLFFAFLPAGALGFILYKLIKGFLLKNPWITVASLIIGGVFLILFEKFFSHKSNTSLEKLSIPQSILIGIGQSLAIIPGVSRAAASIVSGMLVGLPREDAVEFSFLLAVPTIAAASVLDLLKSSLTFQGNQVMLLILGSFASCIVALLTIKIFINYVKTHSFVPFGIYRIVIGILFLILSSHL